MQLCGKVVERMGLMVSLDHGSDSASDYLSIFEEVV